MKIRKRRIVVITLALMMALSTPFQGSFAMASADKDNSMFKTPGHYSLNEITDKFANQLSGEEMLLYDAFVYQGWRTSSGHWLDAVMVNLHDRLTNIGFKDEKRTTAGNQGDCVWYQYETGADATTTTWNPQYASVTVVSSPSIYSIDRDTVSSPSIYTIDRDAVAKKVDFVANCIDPTSMYYPSDVTPKKMVESLKSPGSPEYIKMQQVNNRCHLASDSPFTALTDPSKSVADNITAGTIRAQVIDCGTVTKTSNSKGIPASELSGKIILANGSSSRSSVRTYAASVGAVATMCNQIKGYNMPTIDGVQWYTNAAQYAAAGDYTANKVVAFNTSLDQYKALSALCADGPTYLDICALGTYESDQPVRCLVAEIQGSTKPEERIIVPSHINEPGACDNASGVAMNYEIVSKLKKMIDKGEIARPERTITFIWGDEIAMTERWIAKYSDEFNNIKGSIDLDMTGENPDLTGGHMLIEKTPDPSDVATDAVDASLLYRYGNSKYPGQTDPPPYNVFVRQPDKFSLWTGTVATSETPMNNYPGFYLNDLYLQTALNVQKSNPNFLVASNPYEGGSDHTPFVTAADTYGAPVPAMLTWHFTDYVYHSSCDTLDKLSTQEMHDVGLTSMSVIYQMANGDEYEVADTMDHVMAMWETRLAEEMQNTSDHYAWQMKNDPSNVDSAYNMELKAISDWSRWYIEAVRSPGKYMIGGTIGTPYKLSKTLQDKEDKLVAKIQQNTISALNNADKVFGKTAGSHPTQVASAYLSKPIFVASGTTFEQLVGKLPSKVTVEYIGGGTGEANVTWTSSTFEPSADRPSGLFRVTGTLSGLGSGVINPAAVLAVAEVNAYASAMKPDISIASYDLAAMIGDNRTIEAIAEAYDGGTLKYEWYKNTTASNKGGELVGTGSSYKIPCQAAGTFYYYVVVTNTNEAAPGAKTAVATSDVVKVTVSENTGSNSHKNPKPTPATPTAPTTTPGLKLTSGEASKLAANTFHDVKETAWYAEAVGQMMNSGLMKGTTSTLFAPGSLFDRGMIATVLYRMAGSPAATGNNSFSDVAKGSWYHDAVVWGASNGIINGYNGSYDPTGPVTREQVAAILYRYAVSTGRNVTAKDSLASFTDRGDVSDFAGTAMNWAVANGIITGSTDKTLNPKSTATRAEVAAMLMRAVDLLQK